MNPTPTPRLQFSPTHPNGQLAQRIYALADVLFNFLSTYSRTIRPFTVYFWLFFNDNAYRNTYLNNAFSITLDGGCQVWLPEVGQPNLTSVAH